MIAYVNGEYRCYSTENGIKRHYLGCRHSEPRTAKAHVHPVYVSPRRSGSGVTPSTEVVPPSLGEGSTPLPEPQGSRLQDRPAI